MIAGAIFAGTGRAGLNVVVVGVVAVAASIVGAEIGYLIGRFAGRELILRYGRWVFVRAHHLDRAEATVSRYGGIVVVIARYIVGLREANGIIAGVTQMRWLTFAWFNVLGACAWVATWVSVGYLAGDAIGTIYRNINRFGLYALLVLAVLLAGYIIRRVVRRRHRALSVTTEASETSETEDSEAEQSSVTEIDSVVHEDSEIEEDSEARDDLGTSEKIEIIEDLGTKGDHETAEDREAGHDSVTQESS